MKKSGQNIISCKNCGERRIQKDSTAFFNASAIIFIAGFVIPFLGWFVFLPLGGILLLIAWLQERSSKTRLVRCAACKHKFKVSSETYKEYLQAIK